MPDDYPHPSSPAATAVMKGNRSTGTRPEVALRSALHRRGLRFRKNMMVRAGDLGTRPDIVFTRPRLAVFVDGCFWHGCPEHGTRPSANRPYWDAKLARNRARDRAVDAALEAAGWHVVRIWEHESLEHGAARVASILAKLDGRD